MATAIELARTAKELFSSINTDAHSMPAKKNVGSVDRSTSVGAGALLAAAGLARRDLPGLLMTAIGGALVYRGATGHCYAYDALGISTAEGGVALDRRLSAQGIDVEESVLIDKPAEELFQFWRRLENLPAIMTHLQSIRVIDERRSHWVADAPSIAGGSVEWDAEILNEQPNERIVWHSLPGGDVDTRGSVEFRPAPGDRGTYVRLKLEYLPPAGRLGSWVASVFGVNPQSTIREGLRNFKRVMEIGDVLTTDGQPRGACVGGIGRLLH